eukprot:4771961-Pleurochrysis_carterae.AAC.2
MRRRRLERAWCRSALRTAARSRCRARSRSRRRASACELSSGSAPLHDLQNQTTAAKELLRRGSSFVEPWLLHFGLLNRSCRAASQSSLRSFCNRYLSGIRCRAPRPACAWDTPRRPRCTCGLPSDPGTVGTEPSEAEHGAARRGALATIQPR